MKSDKLLVDKDKQSSLKDETKYLVDEISTTIIEILEGKSVKELYSSNEAEKLFKYMQYPDKSFKENEDGRLIIEYTDSIGLLKNYYAADPYSKPYKAKILQTQEGSSEFVYGKFKTEYDNQCKMERDILEVLRITRNDDMGHAIERANMGEIYIWIRQMMKYLECFTGYRIQVLSKYDKLLADPEILKCLDCYYTKASELKKQCFASKADCKEFRFGKNTYIVSSSDDDKDDFGMLITDMARRWDIGISYLKSDKRNDAFTEFLEESFEDMDVIMKHEKLHKQLTDAKDGSIEESMVYMNILYLLYPEISGLYWMGTRYSESYFASLVLQMMSRHPKSYSIEDKVKTLLYRINNSEQWNNSEGGKKGLGINVIKMCSREILSKYFLGQNDKKGYELAKTFENNILSAQQLEKEVEDIKDKYDEIIIAILALTAHMRGKVTYILPVPKREEDDHPEYEIFQEPSEFKTFFIKYMNSGVSVDEVASFVHKIRFDTNLKWWIDNYDMFEGKNE